MAIRDRPPERLRAEPLVRQPRPLAARRRRAAQPDRRGRHPRRHVEPDDLREGDGRRRRATTSSSQACGDGGPLDRGRVLAPRRRRHRQRRRPAPPGATTRRGGADGFVSVEVSPDLAHDTDGTIAQAKELFGAARPPERDDQDPGDRRRAPGDHGERSPPGINVNVTLIFSLDAPRRGDRRVPRRASSSSSPSGGDLATVVVGRVVLREPGRHRDRPPAPRGQPAARQGRGGQRQARVPAVPASASRATRWDALAAKGARLQRPLWASTSTKNPAYSPTLYVDS